MKAILEKLWDETARVERVIFLAGALGAGDSFPDDLEEFFEDEDEKDIEKCLGKIPDYVDFESGRYQLADTVFEWLRDAGKLGYLVQFATPVMTPTDAYSRTYSWGHYSTTWVYGESIEEAIDLGMKWVKDRRRAEDRKAKAKKGSES